jgi:hypothetical protein
VASAALAAVLVPSLVLGVHPWYDPTNDGAMYIATARSLAAGEGYRYLGEPFVIRPPGFSLLLAPLVAWRGTDFLAFHGLVAGLGALGVLLLQRWLFARLGALLATLVALLLWFNPGFQRLSNQVMSDVPGFSALVGCLLLAARPGARSPRVFGLGVALGLATLLRSGNLLLAPALLASAAFAAWKARTGVAPLVRRSCALVAGLLLVLAPWALRDRAVAPAPPADQTLLHSYSSGMWHTDMGDPCSPRLPLAAIAARFPKQMGKSLHTLGTRLREGERRPWTPVVAGLLLLALLVAGFRRPGPEVFFSFATLAVVAFYFGYAGRLLLPVYAFAVAAVITLLRDAGRFFLGPRAGTGLAALAALGWIALDWAPRDGWPQIEARHRAHAALAEEVRARLPAETRLGAYRAWHHAVYLERPVFGFEQSCARAGGPGQRQAIEATVARYGLDAIWLGEIGLPEVVAREERAFAAAVNALYGGPSRGLVWIR